MNTNRKYLFGGALAVLLLALSFTFPTTRALASQFLGIFRVERFAAISVSPQQLEMLENLDVDEGLYPGDFTFDEDGIEGREFATLEEASLFVSTQSASFWGVRTLYNIGTPTGVYVDGGGSGTLTVNLDGARGLLEAAGADPLVLPDSLDGQDISADLDLVLAQTWDGLELIQMPSPVFNYPTDVDPAPIGQALLQLLGMDESEAARLARNIDWTNTLLLPIPAEFATFREVAIDGTTGLLIESLDDDGASLLWQNGDMVYMLTGDLSADDLIAQADNLGWTFFD